MFKNLFEIRDKNGWPLEMFENRPIKNFIRVIGMLLLGRAKIVKSRNYTTLLEKWDNWRVSAPQCGSDLCGLKNFTTSLKTAHYVDIRIRSNGKYYHSHGDWIKYLAEHADKIEHNCDCEGPR
jgi:hypothetical protein